MKSCPLVNQQNISPPDHRSLESNKSAVHCVSLGKRIDVQLAGSAGCRINFHCVPSEPIASLPFTAKHFAATQYRSFGDLLHNC